MIQTLTPHARLRTLTAFCARCPEPTEVTACLAQLSFSLAWAMPEKRYNSCPPTPPQYHYHDGNGTEVIFLAGTDTPDGTGYRYPNHASRWWLYPGSSQYAYNLVVQELCRAYKLQWFAQSQGKS